MPVTQRPIKNSLCYSSDAITNTENVIKDISFRSLIGCITQLSELANKSSEVFSELVVLSTATNARLNVLVKKTVTLSETISSINIERSIVFAVEKGDHNSQSYTNTLQVPQTQRLADRSAMPISIKSAYEAPDMRRTPAFYELDTYKGSFMNGSKIVSITHKYSNPSFFLNQWCLAQEARMRKIEAEREKQKEEKKVRRTHEPDATQDQDNRRSKKKNSISWQDRYSVNGQPVHRATERKSVSLPPTADTLQSSRPASEGGAAFGGGATQQGATETDDKNNSVSGSADITSGNATDAPSVNAPGPVPSRLPPLSGGLPPRKKDMGAEDVAPVKTVTATKTDGGAGHVRHVSFDAALDESVKDALKSPDAVTDKTTPPVSILKNDTAARTSSLGVAAETPPPPSTSPLTVSRPNSSKTVDTDRLSTDSLSPSDFSHLESVPDSDDDSDYDPSVDYRQDPQYNVHEPGTVDLADAEMFFVSSVPLLRTNSVRSNATLRYSTVYKSTNVSTRIPPNQIGKQQTEVDGDATPPMNGHLPTVSPPNPSVQHPTLSLSPPTASVPSDASDSSPKIPSPKPPSPPPPPKLSPPPPAQKLSIFPQVDEAKAVEARAEVNTQVAAQLTAEQEKPALASPAASTTFESTAQKSPPARVSPPPPPPPPKTNNSPPASAVTAASSEEGDAERPTSSIFSFFAAQPAPPAANKPVPPPPPPPLGASPVPKNYLEDDDAAAFTVPIFKAAMPKPPPPPPPPSTNAAAAPSNHRQSQRLSQRLLVKSIRLSSTPSTQPVAFHIESERIPEDDEPPAAAEPPHLIIKAKDEAVPAAAPPVLNIFAAIRRGSTLKKVDLAEESKKKQEHVRNKSIGGFGDSSVAAILERRKFLEAESSGSDSDRDDDDWQ